VSGGVPTATAADFVSTLPLANVKDRIIKKVARTSTNALTSVCLKVLLPKERLIGIVALINHNLSTTATMRVKAYKGTTNATTLLFDSGATNKVWPAVVPQKQMSWGDTNFWLGTIEEDQRVSYTSLATYFASVNKGGRLIEIIITDTANANGYLQFGRVFVGQWIEPKINPEYGDINQGYIDSTEVQDIPGAGTEYFYKHAKKRTVTVSWKHLGISDALSGIYDAYRNQGISGEVLYVYSKNAIDRNYYARTFLARFANLDQIGMPYLDAYSATINLQEIL
jgi:hypothetical protein